MKQLLIISSILFFFLFYPLSVYSQTDDISTTRKQEAQERLDFRRQLLEDRKEELHQRITDRRATVSARLEEARKQRIRNHFALMVRRMNAAIIRLERLIERIEARLAKFEEENPEADTTAIHQDLDTAKGLLDEAKASLDAAQASLEDVLSSQDPKDAFGVIRETISEVKDQLKEVHRILVKVIGNIKGLRVGSE